MDETRFDVLLESADLAPSDFMAQQITPFKKAMNRILWGCGLCSVTLNFYALNVILPAIGFGLCFLGFRALKNQNIWFRAAFYTAAARTALLWVCMILESTIFWDTLPGAQVVQVLTWANIALLFVMYFALWRGLVALQREAGLPVGAPSAFWLVVWYAVILTLVFVSASGTVIALVMLAAYAAIIWGLVRTSRAVDSAGYAVKPASVKISDFWAGCILWGVLIVGVVSANLLFGSYFMDWQPAAPGDTMNATRAHLTNLGFPQEVLNDIQDADLQGLENAVLVIQNEPGDSGIAGDQENVPKVKGIAVKMNDDARDAWRIYHWFEWDEKTKFVGTECIQLWPAWRLYDGWLPSGDVSGKLYCTKNGTALMADYCQNSTETYTSQEGFFGPYTSTDVFLTFSFGGGQTNCRGYVAYDIVQGSEGMIVDSWFNYGHQISRLQYPAKTARQHCQSSMWDNHAFVKHQTALQFYPSDDKGVEII